MIKSLDKALNILEIFSQGGGKYTLAELVGITQINKSTLFHILDTLLERQVLQKDPQTKEYFLGNRTFEYNLLPNTQNPLYTRAHPWLLELSTELGCPIDLSILMGDLSKPKTAGKEQQFVTTIHQMQQEVQQDTLITSEQCKESAIFQPAVYLCFIAFSVMEEGSDDFLENYIKLNQRRLKPKKNYQEFVAEISEVKNKGYSFCEGEYRDGQSCFAFPIINGRQQLLGVISLSLDNATCQALTPTLIINKFKYVSKSISASFS